VLEWPLITSQRKVDIAIIEVGMGGRLDATNISPVSISNYQYWFRPHTILGNTIEAIAGERQVLQNSMFL
jgi:dihydrofolate synthase/folylpolyglutamate synthase